MRARLARSRQPIRGRLVAPVAAAAAVALVGGVVVAAPDAPTVRGEVQTVAVTASGFDAGIDGTIDLQDIVDQGEWEGIVITGVIGLPEGLEYDDEGGIAGTAAASGTYDVQVSGTVDGEPVTVPVSLVVNNADGSAPAGAEGGSTDAVQGSLGQAQAGGQAQVGGGAQADGEMTTGSDGADAILGVVAGIVGSLGGDAGSAAELAAGSTGGGETDTDGPDAPDAPDAPASPLGSLATGELDMGSLGGGDVVPENPENQDGPESPNGSVDMPGSSGTIDGETGGDVDGDLTVEAGGDATGGIDTQSVGPLGSLIGTPTDETETGSTGGGETTGGGEITIPGSTTSAQTGSLGELAPGLALTGASLLGLAGLSLVLGGGSSTPGSTALLPSLPGSSNGTGSGTGTGSGSSGNGNGEGSSGSVAPTVAAGAPAPDTTQAPGPTVANGRG